ncbi:MAG TPA: hypothetical protein VGC92_10415 [Phenylobacterium sp.]|jgi:hypothetical protein
MSLHDSTTETVIVTPAAANTDTASASSYGGRAGGVGPGLIVVAIGWLAVAAAMVFIGGAVFVGIFQDIAGG